MSYLTALLGMYCEPGDYPSYTQEELDAMAREQQQLEERMKHSLLNTSHFDTFARSEGSAGGALGVKILRDKTGLLHIMNTKKWGFHYPFCTRFLKEERTLEEFNEQVYTGKDRSMMFATIVAYPKADNGKFYCVELNPADPMVPGLELISEFFAQVKKQFMVDEKTVPELYFHPTSTLQIEAIKDKQLSIPVIHSSTLFGDIPYKAIQTGKVNYKRVSVFFHRQYTQADLQTWLDARTTEEIVVIPEVPNDIPAVGGVICNKIIPPLCHVALLCQNRKTPCCFYKDATRHAQRLQGLVSHGVIANVGFYLEPEKRLKYMNAKSDPVEPIVLPDVDTMTGRLIDLSDTEASNARVVGAKASQLAKIEALYSQPIFKGTFTIPFHHHFKHARNNQSAEAPVDHELVQSVLDKIVQNKWTSVIFRSSTNAEDLPGFNGAGLYESVPLIGKDATDPEKISHAIKTVWASVRSSRAVKERRHYNMDSSKVHMAVLVQPYICDKMSDVQVIMNGVCITHDVARHKVKHGFVVNTFPGNEFKVTNHYKDASPESVTLLLNRQKDSVDVHLNSLCSKSVGPLLTQSDAVKLVDVFGTLHNTMLGSQHSMNSTTALDIEFLIVNNKTTNTNRELVVLQARPYQVNVAPEGVDYDTLVERSRYLTVVNQNVVFFKY